MIYENAYLYITPGCEEEFEQALLTAAPILESAEGCTSVKLHRDVETPGAYLLRVGWASLEHHVEMFPKSEQAPRFAEAIEHFFAKAPELRHFAADPVGTPSTGE
ncbi:antibiotic biosynthesis monooxygenase family protein [Streptomyces sp. NPDC051636]|uniref:antibiotic biosynthesis monooxygenase family protein n=1 Tax=Streptomyces sp. NPDC051636 TaxID=3365663 RepID=UPI0037B3FB2C